MYDENTSPAPSRAIAVALPQDMRANLYFPLSFLFYFQVRQRRDNCGAKKKKKKGGNGSEREWEKVHIRASHLILHSYISAHLTPFTFPEKKKIKGKMFFSPPLQSAQPPQVCHPFPFLLPVVLLRSDYPHPFSSPTDAGCLLPTTPKKRRKTPNMISQDSAEKKELKCFLQFSKVNRRMNWYCFFYFPATPSSTYHF